MAFDLDFQRAHAFKPVVQQPAGQKPTQFLVNSDALDIMALLYELIEKKDQELVVSDTEYKFKFEGKIMQKPMEPDSDDDDDAEEGKVVQEPQVLAKAQIDVNLHEVKQGEKYMVSFTRKEGSNIAFRKAYDEVYESFVSKVSEEMAD